MLARILVSFYGHGQCAGYLPEIGLVPILYPGFRILAPTAAIAMLARARLALPLRHHALAAE